MQEKTLADMDCYARKVGGDVLTTIAGVLSASRGWIASRRHRHEINADRT